jgi:hypothetical protein
MSKARHIIALIGGLAVATAGSTTISAQARYGYQLGDPNRLAGTYQLDRAKSDNPQQVVNRVTRSLQVNQNERGGYARDRGQNARPSPDLQNLIDRLDSPDTLAIDLNGRSVTIMSSNAPRLVFDADGRDRSEAFGVTTHADLYGDELTVSTSGNRGNDFTVRFEPIPGGLRVTRQLDSDYLQTPVVAQSVYRRAADQPRWNVYGGSGGGMLVPDATRLTARLDRSLSTRTTREGERFTVTVIGGPYRGAVIDGVVGRVSGRGGRADMVFDFDRMRLSDGRSGSFEGDIESVRMPDGTMVRVDRSGVVRDRNRPDASTLQDGAVGAGLGAIIGAIVGGGKGAAIGAIVGGAGTIIVEGRDDLNLPAGTLITIAAFSPRYSQSPQ